MKPTVESRWANIFLMDLLFGMTCDKEVLDCHYFPAANRM